MKHITFEEPEFTLITFASADVYCEVSGNQESTGSGEDLPWPT